MNSDQFEQLYAEHAEPLLRFLVYRTGDRATAEEVLADTFERVLRSRKGFDRRKASAKTWIYSIALIMLGLSAAVLGRWAERRTSSA